jgi:hypothetical protein
MGARLCWGPAVPGPGRGDRVALRPLRRPAALGDSLAALVGNAAYNTDTLRAGLHRFVFLLGVSDGEDLFGEPTP